MLHVYHQVVVNVQLISLTLLVTMLQAVAVCIRNCKIAILYLLILGSCPPDKPPIYCLINPCDHQNCSNFPDAQCVLDNCGQCQGKFIINETDVTDQCRKFLKNLKNIHNYYNSHTFKQDPVQYKVLYSNYVDLHVLIHVLDEN